MELTFTAVDERKLGPAWQQAFAEAWPGWRAWYLRKGGERRLADAEQQLRRHMPELVPVWRRQVELAGGDEVAARFLTFWNPPAYLVHCSQAVLVDRDGPILVRNYDLDPRLSEATVLRSAWTGRAVVATMEAIAGAADGVNAAGLAVSLAFGGRRVRGEGFGVPLIVRYLLGDLRAHPRRGRRPAPDPLPHGLQPHGRRPERRARHGVPVARPSGRDRAPAFRDQPSAPGGVGRAGALLPHRRAGPALERLLAGRGLTAGQLIDAFLAPPLYSSRHGEGFGTVYTAAYRPADASVELRWPGQEPWRLSCDRFAPAAGRWSMEVPRRRFRQASPSCWPSACVVHSLPTGPGWAGSGPGLFHSSRDKVRDVLVDVPPVGLEGRWRITHLVRIGAKLVQLPRESRRRSDLT